MEPKKTDFPGITVYDNFILNPNEPSSVGNIGNFSYGAMIVAEINPTQYYRDRPLFLGYKEPLLSDAISWSNKEYTKFIEDNDILNYLDLYDNILEGTDGYLVQVEAIKNQINSYSTITENDPDNVDYPSIPVDNQDIAIKDADGNVIRTITTDINQRSQKLTPDGLEYITILDNIPKDYLDTDSPTNINESSIVSLEDSFIKEKLWVSHKIIPELSTKLAESSDQIENAVVDFNDAITPIDPNPDPSDYIEQLSKPVEMWYGIPLINLSPSNTLTKDSFIVQINTHNNWTIDITNILGTGLEGFTTTIDKTIPPATKFMVSVFIHINRITLILKIANDPATYTNTIILEKSLNTTLTSFGSDNEGVKSLCGYIWDMRVLRNTNAYNDSPDTPIPYIPPDGFIYDGNNDRINGDAIYPIGNGRPPAYNGGNWMDLDEQWKLIQDGYIDRFFCRSNLKNRDFSIIFYMYHAGYPNTIKTLLADNINNNYIKYDYKNFILITNFNGFYKETPVVIPNFLWTQVSIRFLIDTNELVVMFRDFYWDRIEKMTFDIGINLNFELMSLLGRFDEDLGRYVEIQQGVSGMLQIHDTFQTDNDLDISYQNHKRFLNQYDIRSKL